MTHKEGPEGLRSGGGFPADDRGAAAAARESFRPDPDVDRAIERFLDSQRMPRTRSEYGKAILSFLKFAKIRTMKELLAVDAHQVIRYRNALQSKGVQPSTITLRLAALSGMFAELVAQDRMPGNPADAKLVKRLRVGDVSKTEGLTIEEVNDILATCDGTLKGLRDRAILMTLYYQGLRRSEAAKLSWRDLTTRRGLLEVKQAKNNPYDTVRLRPEVKRAIEDFQEVLGRELRRRETRPDDPVFTSLSKGRLGKRLSPKWINNMVKARAKEAGIDRRITAHSWRHTCTTHSLGAGVPLHHVQRHLRHKDVRTTLRYDRDRDVRRNPNVDALPHLGE